MNEQPNRRWAMRSSRVCLPDGVLPATIVVDGAKISAVLTHAEAPVDVDVESLGDLVISPGIIDTHVHVNEPGRTEWEGFRSATRAAVAGGVTTIVDMPLNSSPVTTTVAALQQKRRVAAENACVNVEFYGGLVPGNAAEIPMLLDEGVVGIKAFLCDSGLDEFPAANESDLRTVLPSLAQRGVPLLAHAELMLDSADGMQDPRSYDEYLASRPDAWEESAISLLIELCREFCAPIHIVHLSSARALAMIESARQSGLPLSVETCPHYLYFAAEDIPDGQTKYKCAPPIRGRQNQASLRAALDTGLIDTIGSDHSPCLPEMKHLDTGDFSQAWGGISSLQLTLPIMWTIARQEGWSLPQLASWLSTSPATLIGIDDRTGRIQVGYDADLCVWDPEHKWNVAAADLQHRHKVTPYDGEGTSWQSATHLRSGRIAMIAAYLNAMSNDELRRALEKCCAAEAWVNGMISAKPFTEDVAVENAAKRIAATMSRDDWLEAFAAHPRIGDVTSLREKFANTQSWAAGEQDGVTDANEATILELAQCNDEYFEKFGYIFIVCATGKSADEMLSILKSRLHNSPDDELAIAAARTASHHTAPLTKAKTMTSPITTHVLDTSTGRPAVGIEVTLEILDTVANDWKVVGRGETDDDGRITDLLTSDQLEKHPYRISFRVDRYFASQSVASFYPMVRIEFVIHDLAEHYHVPLLLSPFGYSTYRGS